MSDPFIPPELVPRGVNDARGRAFAAAFGEILSRFSTASLLVQDAWTVPASLLPAMTLETGMSEFVSPGMREEHVRALVAAAPEIHAMTGTIAGVRRALAAVGIQMQWTQWFEEEPPGHHDTHKVFLFADEVLVSGEEMFSYANQAAARRLIDATKRWSQDVAVSYGVRAGGAFYVGALGRASFTAVAHPLIFDFPVLRTDAFVGATAATLIDATAHHLNFMQLSGFVSDGGDQLIDAQFGRIGFYNG